MDFQPILKGSTLSMRPMTPSDWDAAFAIGSDPLIWEVHPMHERWQEPVFRAYFDDGIASGGMLAAVDNTSGAMIGSSRYSTEFTEDGEVEIGWTFLSRDYWGGQSNREMKHLMLTHALADFEKVIFRVGEANGRSRRAVEKIGGKLIDRKQMTQFLDREIVHVTYVIRRADFKGLLR